MAASAKIIDLRNLLAERFPHPSCTTAKRLITGLPFLEESIGGGLPRGAITELISPGTSAGSASLIHALIHCAYRDNYFLALIDGRDSFDPCGLDNTWLQHLLWVRCSKASEAVKAADLLLRDGNFPLVIVDLVLNAPEELRKIPQTNWYRLQRLVEVLPTACLVLTRYEMVSSAQLKLVLENSWDIQTFESEDALSRLRIVVKRSHLAHPRSPKSAISGQLEMMFATIYLPNFYLQAATRHQPELCEKPVALIEEHERKPVVIQLNEAAENAGIRKGMTPSQALARSLQVVIKVRAPTQEKSIQEILLHYAFTLSPFVEDTAPGVCTVQFTDCRNLSEKVGRVIEQLAECEIRAQAAVAPTSDSSFLAAHLARPVLQIENAKEFLAPLPIETLAMAAT